MDLDAGGLLSTVALISDLGGICGERLAGGYVYRSASLYGSMAKESRTARLPQEVTSLESERTREFVSDMAARVDAVLRDHRALFEILGQPVAKAPTTHASTASRESPSASILRTNSATSASGTLSR